MKKLGKLWWFVGVKSIDEINVSLLVKIPLLLLESETYEATLGTK